MSIADMIENAEVAEAQVILDPCDYMRSARVIIDYVYRNDERIRTLHRYRGEFWRWSFSHYRMADDETIRSAIWDFLDKAKRNVKDGDPVPFKPDKRIVANVFDALCAQCQLDSSIEVPFWLDGYSSAPANEFIAVGNGLFHLPTRKLSVSA
jgi:hypothetical protein